MAAVFTNGPYMVLFIVIGGAVGFFNAFSTQLSQLMCARGYDDVFSGMCGSLLLGTGFVGTIFTGVKIEKYGRNSIAVLWNCWNLWNSDCRVHANK